MATVAAFYTAQALVGPCSETFADLLPDSRLINIVDDGFISDVISNNGMNSDLGRRLLRSFEAAEAAGADYIFSTCSSIGDYIESARQFIRIPIVRIDAAMAIKAVTQVSRVAVLATLATTLGPTVRLVQRHARRLERDVELIEGLAQGAFQALQGGDMETHNRLILETAKKLSDRAELFLLAQGSMAAMGKKLEEETGKPILTSLGSGLSYLKDVVENGADANT